MGNLPVRVRVEDDGQILTDVSLAHCPGDDFDFLECILWRTREGSTADDKYTTGDCDVFAAALKRLHPEGKLIAVYDPYDPFTGRKTRGAPYLIHAGLLLEHRVLDIRGTSEKYDWITTHRENGNASDSWGWREVSLNELEKMQKTTITEAAIEEAMPYARIVTILDTKDVELTPVLTF
jgi:uncharacterized protein (UPF0248 family)